MDSRVLLSPKLEAKDLMETVDVHSQLNQLVLQSKESASKALEVVKSSYINDDVDSKMETMESLLSNVGGFLDLCLEALDSITSEIRAKAFPATDELALDIKVENEELDSLKQQKDCYVRVERLSEAAFSSGPISCDTETEESDGSIVKSGSRAVANNDYHDYHDAYIDSELLEESENTIDDDSQIEDESQMEDDSQMEDESQDDLLEDEDGVKDESGEVLKCPKCDYNTTNKKYFQDHVTGGLKWRKCPWCSFHSQMKMSLAGHLRSHYTSEPVQPYQCIKCQSGYKDIRMLELHVIKSHNIKVQFHCDKCELSSNSARSLTAHREKHSGNTVPCKTCDYVAPGVKTLKAHRRKYHNSAKCDTCDIKFPSRADLSSHFTKMHKVPCEHCGKLVSQHRMNDHVQVKHSKMFLNCDQCEYSTRDKKCLSKHLRKHSNDFIYCEFCAYKTPDPFRLKVHINMVHLAEENMLECDQCTFKTKYKGSLKNHVERSHSETGAQYPCEFCERVLTSQASLKGHKKTLHAGERFNCPTEGCSYSHHNKEALKNHERKIHQRLQLFCDMCSYATHAKGNLEKHKKNQHEGRVFNCDLCEYSSHQQSVVKDHKEYVHLGITHPCDKCTHVARDKASLKKHVKFVHLGIAFHCEHCTYKADTKYKFYRHLKGVHKIERDEEKTDKKFVPN